MIRDFNGPEPRDGCFFCGLAFGLGLTLIGVCTVAWFVL